MPFGRLRRGETPASKSKFVCGKYIPKSKKSPSGKHFAPDGIFLVLHGILGEEQLGGASADAQSYWQGRFAACAFVECV